jgi:diguanylate cyclase
MAIALDPLIGLCLAVCAGAMFLRRSSAPSPALQEHLHEAIDRLGNGERNVRIASDDRRDARLVSRFNATLAQIESGAFDWERAPPEELALFRELRSKRSSRLQADGSTFVVVMEVDRFAVLRRSIGYRLANRLLSLLAERVTAALPDSELGRIGRTTIEFAFRAANASEAQLRLLDTVAALEQRLTIDDYVFDLSVAMGFADAGASSIQDELVDQATAALHAAQAGRVKVCFADAAILAQGNVADLELMGALPKAIAAGEVSLHYQPKLEARTNQITSAEALIRWHRPGTGLVPTDRFIALAEETGAIRDLTEWVLARAVADQKALLAQGREIEIYVNISGQLLPDPDFAQAALGIVGEAAGKIGFEITETAVIGDPDAALANLRAFTAAGIRIAIDDYGSGLSSLAYLKQLPANELKIDRLFVSGLTDSHRDPLIIRSSIDLAHALEMSVTAEGVDDGMALSLLRIMGCDLLQGYFISPPLPLDAFVAFLTSEEEAQRLAALGNAQWPIALGG